MKANFQNTSGRWYGELKPQVCYLSQKKKQKSAIGLFLFSFPSSNFRSVQLPRLQPGRQIVAQGSWALRFLGKLDSAQKENQSLQRLSSLFHTVQFSSVQRVGGWVNGVAPSFCLCHFPRHWPNLDIFTPKNTAAGGNWQDLTSL